MTLTSCLYTHDNYLDDDDENDDDDDANSGDQCTRNKGGMMMMVMMTMINMMMMMTMTMTMMMMMMMMMMTQIQATNALGTKWQSVTGKLRQVGNKIQDSNKSTNPKIQLKQIYIWMIKFKEMQNYKSICLSSVTKSISNTG